MIDFLLSGVAILSFFLLGMVFDYYFLNRRKLHFNLAIYFGLGLGIVTLLLMLLGILGIEISRVFVFVLTGVLVLIPILDRQLGSSLKLILVAQRKKVNSKNLALLAPVIFCLVIVAMVTFSQSIWGYDAFDRWMAKASAFWFDGVMNWGNLHGPYLADDPNLWPLTAAWFFHFLGSASDFWVRLIPFTALVCLVLEFWRKVKGSGFMGFGWLVILLLSPYLWGTITSISYSGNADLLVSFYFLLAFGTLFEKKFVYSALFFGLAGLTKNDAVPAVLGFCILLLLFKFWTREKVSVWAFVAGFGMVAINLGWKYYFDLNSRFLQQDLGVIWAQRPIVEYTRYSLNAFREEFRFVDRWGVGFLVIMFFLVAKIRVFFVQRWLLMGLLIFGVLFSSYIYIYYVTVEDQASHITSSIFRLVLQVYPALLLLAYELSVCKYKSTRVQK